MEIILASPIIWVKFLRHFVREIKGKNWGTIYLRISNPLTGPLKVQEDTCLKFQFLTCYYSWLENFPRIPTRQLQLLHELKHYHLSHLRDTNWKCYRELQKQTWCMWSLTYTLNFKYQPLHYSLHMLQVLF